MTKEASEEETFQIYKLSVEEALMYAKPPEQCARLNDFFDGEFGISTYNIDEKLILPHLSKTALVDYCFDSDEEATSDLYYFDGVPFLLYEKYGDRNGYNTEIVNTEVYKKCAALFLEVFMSERLSKLNSEKTTATTLVGQDSSNQYIAFMKSDECLAVHILSPRWQFGFTQMFDTHDAHYDGKLVKFVQWVKENKNIYENGNWEERNLIIIEEIETGKQYTIHGSAIAFALRKPNSGILKQ